METRFEFRDFAKVMGLIIVLYAIFVGIFEVFPVTYDFLQGLHPTISFLLTYLLQFVILYFPIWFFIIDGHNATSVDFGFQKVGIGKLIKYVLLAYLFYLFISVIVANLLIYFNLNIPGYGNQESYLPLFGNDVLGYGVAILFIVFIAPIIEEVFFRGFVYRIFTKTWPVWFGSILTALMFALVHFQLTSIIPLFILGLILNFLYQKTKSIWTSIAFHALNNSIAFGVDIYLSLHPALLEELKQITGLLYHNLTL